MDGIQDARFDPNSYLGSSSIRRKLFRYKAKHVFYTQGGPAYSVFYLHSGRAKLTVVSNSGKEATVTLLAAEDFVGEESLSSSTEVRMATARAITMGIAMRIESREMLRVLHEEKTFSDFFLKFMVARGIRTQADLID